MSDENEIEKVPDCQIFRVQFAWSLEQMEAATSIKDFEIWLDRQWLETKRQIMQVYCDYRPPPKFFPREKNEE